LQKARGAGVLACPSCFGANSLCHQPDLNRCCHPDRAGSWFLYLILTHRHSDHVFWGARDGRKRSAGDCSSPGKGVIPGSREALYRKGNRSEHRLFTAGAAEEILSPKRRARQRGEPIHIAYQWGSQLRVTGRVEDVCPITHSLGGAREMLRTNKNNSYIV
jgi:ribosome modulation factor